MVSLGRGLLAAQDGLQPGDILADLVDSVGLLHLAGRRLEAQVELLLLKVQQRVGDLVGVIPRTSAAFITRAPR